MENQTKNQTKEEIFKNYQKFNRIAKYFDVMVVQDKDVTVVKVGEPCRTDTSDIVVEVKAETLEKALPELIQKVTEYVNKKKNEDLEDIQKASTKLTNRTKNFEFLTK